MIEIQYKKRHVLSILLMVTGAFFLLSLVPNSICRTITRCEMFYSGMHLLFFSALGFLLSIYLKFKRHLLDSKMNDINVACFTLMVTAIFGASTELIQMIPGVDRSASWSDFGYDLIGCGFGILFFICFKHGLKRLSPQMIQKTNLREIILTLKS